jgi:hypothetical protein
MTKLRYTWFLKFFNHPKYSRHALFRLNSLKDKSISSIGGFNANRMNFSIFATALSPILLYDKFRFKIIGVVFRNYNRLLKLIYRINRILG